MAKGRLLGAQFEALFTDGLYFEIGRHAIDMVEKLKEAFREKGYAFHMDSPTNQLFVILDRETLERLRKNVGMTVWEWLDENRVVVRVATTWSTTEEDVAFFKSLL